jgi:hypothetical protein
MCVCVSLSLSLSAAPDEKLTDAMSQLLSVSVTGTVQFGITDPIGFYHSFVLEQDRSNPQKTNSYFVASMTFRDSKTYPKPRHRK